ncbi:MAG: hypothetical protein ACTSQE_17340 [Candidatus Heimdallarchaeaceae archaeon]
MTWKKLMTEKKELKVGAKVRFTSIKRDNLSKRTNTYYIRIRWGFRRKRFKRKRCSNIRI